MMGPLPSIYDLSLDELRQKMLDLGEPAYRANQLWSHVYRRLENNPETLLDLPRNLRTRLAEIFDFASLREKAIVVSQDEQTQKILFELRDGEEIESVLMRYEQRDTACISTQIGCAMGCLFCATGHMGFQRNLSSAEIVAQVLHLARNLANQGQHLSNIVVMGMGEPFHNYDATLEAIDRLNHPEGFNFGARRFTISTVGLVPAIERFATERRQINLAVSLHAATNSLRDALLPVNQRYPLETLIPACREFVRQTGRRITFEWVLIRDINDDLDQANALADLISDLNCHVNLIPLNPTQGYTGKATTKENADRFYRLLLSRGIPCTLRARRGIDIQAGCGQLATWRRDTVQT
ncbi:MAG: 23S rRNA (adenine(2503)-C(2))-methyltransferase RlmN [Anaerolineales bacterium]|nr:23S rRNA (adenine(2503)-C(2))-methyltransferase RlmN [Anaerolineales bacterium]